jgi:hypothetical protein
MEIYVITPVTIFLVTAYEITDQDFKILFKTKAYDMH